MKLKVGDNVVVIAGKDKGTIGLILATDSKSNRVVVEGVNMRTKHIKPSQSNPDGGVEVAEGPIDASNVMINIGDVKDAAKAKVSRITYQQEINKNGRKNKKRIAKANGEEI